MIYFSSKIYQVMKSFIICLLNILSLYICYSLMCLFHKEIEWNMHTKEMFQIMNNDFLMILCRSSLPLLVLQKPFSSGKRLSNNQVRTLTQHTCTSGMWFFSKYADFSGLGKLIKIFTLEISTDPQWNDFLLFLFLPFTFLIHGSFIWHVHILLFQYM